MFCEKDVKKEQVFFSIIFYLTNKKTYHNVWDFVTINEILLYSWIPVDKIKSVVVGRNEDVDKDTVQGTDQGTDQSSTQIIYTDRE